MEDINGIKWITTYKEARKLIKQKGVKVAIAIHGRPEVKVFAEKSDFLNEMNTQASHNGYKGPVDYDGNVRLGFMWCEKERIMYIDGCI